MEPTKQLFLKLAMDNQISLDVVNKISSHYEVILWAGDMLDENWIPDALHLGANVFISPDLDVPNMLDRMDSKALWIDVPQNLKSSRQFDFLMNKLKDIENKYEIN